MKKAYLIDTNIIVDYLRKNEKAASFLDSQKLPIISTITAGEIYQGAKNKTELKTIKKLLNYFEIYPFTKQTSSLSLKLLEKYSLSYGLLILDALIAATSIENNLILLTNNIKHFKMIKGLKLKKW